MDTVILLGLAALAGYLVVCAVWPFAACRWCGGSGKHRSPSGKAWRPCRRCRGSGRRVRLGRRVFEAMRPHG
jgi:hypothetical protein